MPNHYHITITPPAGYSISDTMHHINGVFAARYNTACHRHGRVFQKNFWDHGIRNVQDYVEKAKYIHQNPVKAGIVGSPDEYRWSSAKERLTGERGYLPLDPIP